MRDVDQPTDLAPLPSAPFLDLNNTHAAELSPLDAAAFGRLMASAFYARGFENPPAFLLAFDEGAGDIGPNHRRFRDRHARFVYIDRVAVAARGRGRGIASRLYADLIARARAGGYPIVGCEVNVDPPNPISDAFHARLGFAEVGRAALTDRGKTVRDLALRL